jgi:hypothetical protein
MATVAAVQSAPTAKPPAEVIGEPITEEELDKAIAGQPSKLQESMTWRQRLEALIRNRLLAQEAEHRGMSVQRLLDIEATSKVRLVIEEEIERVYQADKACSRRTRDEDEARPDPQSAAGPEARGSARGLRAVAPQDGDGGAPP